ncbi:MAG: FAD-binding oxidoreductase [Pseudonocardiaceae bacterium]
MVGRARSWWGWGWADQALSDLECRQLAAVLPGLRAEPIPVPPLAQLQLPAPRIAAPRSLGGWCSQTTPDRAGHTYGKAYRDVLRALRGELHSAPDLVAYPGTEADVVNLLHWASEANLAVIPYGGGSSVVGGVEYRGGDHAGVVSLDLSGFGQVLEIDDVSRAARIQAGTFGPALEDQLRPHGYTLRHFPQSFEFSTLGGWLATRAGGHFATLYTRIDDFVESLRVITPAGSSESWRLPGSGAGPSPDRLFLGSEGALGVITEAWLRVQDRPRFKASGVVRFTDFVSALDAVRAVAQSGLHPSNCRLLDPGEALFSGAASGEHSVLVLGFESVAGPVDGALAGAIEIAVSHGGTAHERDGGDAVESWRSGFLRMPYLRDGLARMSGIAETFETACTWDRAAHLCTAVRSGVGAALTQVCGAPGIVNCRITHVYPDGPAPYFTVIAPGRQGSEIAQWDEIKAAASEILHRHRATITHHHAVGRDHRPWYDQQRPDLFAAVLTAAKQVLDPHSVLNPGVLIG